MRVATDPANQQVLELARQATANKDWTTAVRLFREQAKARPETASNWHNLALAQARRDGAGEVADLRRAVLLVPGGSRYLNNLLVGAAGAARTRLTARFLVLAPAHARALADWSFMLLRAGYYERAFDTARRVHVADPSLAEGLARAGEAKARLNSVALAKALYLRYLVLDPTDSAGLGRDLARIGGLVTTQAMTPAFVAGVFDGYAARFDSHLIDTLGYIGPRVLREMLDTLITGPVERVVDLGCGSGLSGLVLRPLARQLIGVDLSARMLERARERATYDALHQAEIVSWMTQDQGRYGLVMAADVSSYLGDLQPFFLAVVSVLKAGGRVAMTAHEQAEGHFGMLEGETYSHSEAYLHRVAGAAGLVIEKQTRGAMREEKKQPLPTLFLILRKL
jgi:predicted TPR repeat methyltransferase